MTKGCMKLSEWSIVIVKVKDPNWQWDNLPGENSTGQQTDQPFLRDVCWVQINSLVCWFFLCPQDLMWHPRKCVAFYWCQTTSCLNSDCLCCIMYAVILIITTSVYFHAVILIIIRSVYFHWCEETLNKKEEEDFLCSLMRKKRLQMNISGLLNIWDNTLMEPGPAVQISLAKTGFSLW